MLTKFKKIKKKNYKKKTINKVKNKIIKKKKNNKLVLNITSIDTSVLDSISHVISCYNLISMSSQPSTKIFSPESSPDRML